MFLAICDEIWIGGDEAGAANVSPLCAPVEKPEHPSCDSPEIDHGGIVLESGSLPNNSFSRLSHELLTQMEEMKIKLYLPVVRLPQALFDTGGVQKSNQYYIQLCKSTDSYCLINSRGFS